MSDDPQDSDPVVFLSSEISGSQTSTQSANPSSSPPNGDGDGDDSREANPDDRKTDPIKAGDGTVPAIVGKEAGAGEVYLNTEIVTFSYGIIEGEAIRTARWLAILDKNVTELQELPALEPKSRNASKRDPSPCVEDNLALVYPPLVSAYGHIV